MTRRLAPLEIEAVVDRAALRAELTAAAQGEGDGVEAAKKILRQTLFRGRAIAQARLEAGENGLAVARFLSKLTDEVVTALFDFTRIHVYRASNPTEGERFAVVAVGGYGRGELAPYSDLDLLFLYASKPSPFTESVTEFMLYALWDLQLKIGHASRNVDDCVRLAKEDHTIQTALLEARLICGDPKLAKELETRFRKEVAERDHGAFIAAKLRERDERHAKVGQSRYMVEPNIKEGKGGLRDLHTLFWMARHRYGFSRPQDYVDAGVFTEEERFVFRRALEFLWTVRCHLHFVTKRAEERLTFDVQPELAKRMGYEARQNHAAVERFMRRYFLVAKQVGMLTRVLCAKLESDNAKRAPRGLKRLLPRSRPSVAVAEPGFHIESGRLNIESPAVLDTPLNLIRLFEIADKRDLDVHPEALAEAARRARAMSKSLRIDDAARKAFLDLATSPRRPGAALRLMNEAGVLGKFMPEFGHIVAQMQFNMYHHFTTDEHTLRAVETISEIEHGMHREQHPLATEVFPKIINRRALYLAMLLHDTGKGGGRDQCVEGEKSARAACERLGLPAEEVELVGWLVRHHLEMSDVAQKRDIADPHTIAQFARTVGSVERLRLLLVLTVADIRAVGNVWNDWKGQLLRDLYRFTEAAFHGGRSDEEGVREHLMEVAAAAKTRLLQDIGPQDGILNHWLDVLDDGYWLNHDAEALAWHAREVLAARSAKAIPHIATRYRPQQGVTEVLIYAGDRKGLFASLAAAISTAGADIADARVHTTRDGAAFDVFSIQTSHRKPFGMDDPHVLQSLVQRLNRAALEDQAPPPPRPPSKRAMAFAIEPWVRIDNDLTPDHTVVEATGRDRPGLLAALARVFADSDVSIVSAHIETFGERASDTFYVEELRGGQIVNTRRATKIRAELEQVLRAAEPAAPNAAGKAPLAVARSSTLR